MQVLYEEEGELKVGAVLAQAPASLQVESPHGRRSKIKAANVLLEFERPSGAELLTEAQRYAAGLDVELAALDGWAFTVHQSHGTVSTFTAVKSPG